MTAIKKPGSPAIAAFLIFGIVIFGSSLPLRSACAAAPFQSTIPEEAEAETSGEQDDEIFLRFARTMLRSLGETGGYGYSGDATESFMDALPGSIARTATSELTLVLCGADRQEEIQAAIDAFHEHWDELEKRRKQHGTHEPPFGIAPYYFYYGHRYLAQSIAGLPEADRAAELGRFNEVLMRTRDDDGTWNDRVFDQSKAYGTAMAVLGLLGE